MSNAIATLLELSSDPIVIVSVEAVIVSTNKAFAGLLGTTAAQLQGRPIWTHVATTEAEFRDILERCCRTSAPLPFAASFRNRQGEPVRCRLQGALVERGDSKSSTRVCLRVTTQATAVQGFQRLNAEITGLKREALARQQAEAELRASEERFRTLTDSISQLAWMADATGWIFWYNQRWYDYTGTTLDAMQGWGWEKVHHPDHLEHVLQSWRQAHATGEPWEDTFPLRGRDGTYRWFLSRALPIRDAEGRLERWFGTNTDVTELREAQACAVESEARFRLMADAAPVLIWISGLDKRWTYFNKGWLDFTGRTMEEDLENGWAEGIHADDLDRCLQTYVEAFAKHEPFEMEYRLRRFDGEFRWVLNRAVPRYGSDREFLGYIASCLDITDFKRSQEALQESEQRLGGIISSAMDAIITIDHGQRVTDFNHAAERMFGWAASEAIGGPVDRFIPDRFRAMHAHHIEGFGQTHVTKRQMGALGTIYGRRADGEEFPIEASISQWQTRAGKFYTVILRDVSERVRQQDALRVSEARYRDLVHALPAALYTCDRDGRITLYNQAAVALWGREPEIGKDLWCGSWKIYRPDGAPLPLDECPMAVTLREGQAVRGEEIIIERPDGTRRHILPHPEPIKNERGEMVGAINMLLDITERMEAEKAIANLAAIVTSSDDAIVGKNLQGIVTTWNRAAERLFGYTADEMIGQSITRLIPPDRQNEEPAILERLARGEPIHHYETIRRRKDGTDLHISLSVSPVIDFHGRIIGASKIARDITEQKRVQEALRERDRELTAVNEALTKQTAALADSNKELESFSYSVSHDLRAPLRTIDAFSRIVMEEHGAQLDPEAQRCLNIVRKAAGQAGELIDDLLELSRLGRQSMQIRAVPMDELVRETADDLGSMQQSRPIDLLLGELPPCHGDRRLLKLVWTNLLGNAFKYTQYVEVARIEVGWTPDDQRADGVVYYVKDNGVGFDMRYAGKLFGVFQRLHRKEEFDGTGVGLAIVQRIVSRHGGRVWAEGKVNGGACFYFSLGKAAA
jgi:PAS domain S-box-containing protein